MPERMFHVATVNVAPDERGATCSVGTASANARTGAVRKR
jgi:hypothetical protein